MADILKKDPVVYQRERERFIQDLKHFHEARGTPIRKFPCVNGKEFDLYLLYLLVTSRGGWVKVNLRNDWSCILDQFGSLNRCVNGQVALKQIYLSYLDRYEKIHFLGETCDRGAEDDEDSRHKRFSARTSIQQQPVVPHLYNYHQHIVPDNIRANGKLSQNLYNPSEYDKLALSLVSPLPNEQDFAINVCALLSGTNNEGKNTTLKLCNHPRLLHYLLAHAAVYNHHSLRNLMEENYKEVRGYSLKYFWSDVLEDKELSILMDEKKYVKRRLRKLPGSSSASTSLPATKGLDDSNSHSSAADDNPKYGDDEVDCRLKLEDDDKALFCVGRSYGTQDFVGQRVLQIAMILRNATFIEDNVPTLAQDMTFLRFVLLCCGSRWNCLHQLGFDMLSNIAHEITLEDWLLEHVIRVVNQGLESQDRTVILACVETLNKLGQKEENDGTMSRCIEQKVYDRLCSFISLQDIMLLIHSLECLYSLSSLGEKACNAIVHVNGAVDSLVSLVTVEAQSYGPKACILMRVVETVAGDQQDVEHQSTIVTSVVNHSVSSTPNVTPMVAVSTSSSFVLTSSSSSLIPPLATTVSAVVAPSIPVSSVPVVTVPSSLQSTPILTPAVAAPVAIPATKVLPPQRVVLPSSSATVSSIVTPSVSSLTTITSVPSTTAVTQPSAVAVTQQENENFASQWLKNTFETHNQPGRGVEQGEVYKMYLTACSRAGRRGVIAPLHFPQCVRSVFGAQVGPRPIMPVLTPGTTDTSTSKVVVYEGIQVRAKPLNVTVTPSALTQPVRTPSSPILKAQLSGPSSPQISKKEVKSKVSSTHPHLSNVLLNAGSTAPATTPQLKSSLPTQTPITVMNTVATPNAADSSNNTSLIKSLLASKVGDFVNPKTSTNVKSDKSVLATPHQLVLNTAVAAQVTQRQQQQQQQQLQQHKIVTQPQISGIMPSGDTSSIHILSQPTADVQQKQIVQITQPVSQPQLVQVIQSQEQKPIIQLAQGQQLVQVNTNSDKPQLVQISHPSGQQQLIQITPSVQQQLLQVSQNNQGQPIIQLCSVKQEQTGQSSDGLAPQPVVLSSQSGRTEQVMMTPALQQQLLSQIPQSVQQQLLQAAQGTQSRTVISQQILSDQPTSVAQQAIPITTNETGQQFAFVSQSQLRQLMQEQSKIVQQSSTNLPQLVQNLPVNTVPVKQEPVAPSPVVSVITSTVSVSANSKPYQSRINGVRNFTPMNVVIDEDKPEVGAELTTDEKMMKSPDFSSQLPLGDNAEFPKQTIQSQTNKVIVENHTVSATVGSNFMSDSANSAAGNRNLKLNDLEAELSESSSSQSLPVISIKDTETNLPSCEVANEDSTGMFEDFLINGKSNNALDDTISNNIISDDSLLNNILMRNEFGANIATGNTILASNSNSRDFTSTTEINGPVSNVSDRPAAATNDLKVEINSVTKKDAVAQVVSADAQDINLDNILRNEIKIEEKPASSKNLMLAELLEKNSEKKEPPILNGALRLGDKGLELISKDELQKAYVYNAATNEKSVICSNKKNSFSHAIAVGQKVVMKRTSDQEVQCDSDSKKLRLNGDTKMALNDDGIDDDGIVKASSSAANLYAALAADVLGDIDGMDEEEVSVPTPTVAVAPPSNYQPPIPPPAPTVVESPASQQLYLTSGPSPRQILVASSASGLQQRVAIMGAGGQQYFVTPQTAIVQGQPQTVLVTQTPQQHGTGAKTIIILQSQNATPLTSQSMVTNTSQQKVIMQKIAGSPSPVMPVTSTPIIASTSLPNTSMKSAPPTKLVHTQTLGNAQSSQPMSQQFLPVQSVVSASSQSTTANHFTNVYSINSNNLTQTGTIVNAQNTVPPTIVSQVSQIAHVPQITQVSTFISQASTISTAAAASVQVQAATQSLNSRQVKVIKTIPHLQSVVPNKPTTQIVQQQSPLTTVQPQPQLVHQIPQTQPISSTTTPTALVSQSVSVPAVTSVTSMTVATTAASVVVSTMATSVTSSITHVASSAKTVEQGQYLCEWRSCMRSFKSANEVYLHACAAHCPSDSQEIQCLWERCDAMKRKRFSLMTHLYDRHCNPEILKMMAVRRKQISQSGRSEIPPPLPPAPHPGYAPNAALHAIKRHALEFVNPKELQDDNEGPVTKSIRLTSSLILRNVVIYSTIGRRHVRGYEPHLASVALSNVESSRTIAQILFDMNDHNR